MDEKTLTLNLQSIIFLRSIIFFEVNKFSLESTVRSRKTGWLCAYNFDKLIKVVITMTD